MYILSVLSFMSKHIGKLTLCNSKRLKMRLVFNDEMSMPEGFFHIGVVLHTGITRNPFRLQHGGNGFLVGLFQQMESNSNFNLSEIPIGWHGGWLVKAAVSVIFSKIPPE